MGQRGVAKNTSIVWCDHTFNPWIGCTEVSPACDHCYARTMMQDRYGRAQWGIHPRVRTSDNNWRKPVGWNWEAAQAGVRRKVFCASLADVFDNQVDRAWRNDLWQLIRKTPSLDWLLLTKRPQNIQKMLPDGWGDGWPNVWLGATVETQAEANRRIPFLIDVPCDVAFLSCEPLLERIELPYLRSIDWVICGGESGPGFRQIDPTWARSLRDQCRNADVAFFMKQMSGPNQRNMQPIPDDLLVREMPRESGNAE